MIYKKTNCDSLNSLMETIYWQQRAFHNYNDWEDENFDEIHKAMDAVESDIACKKREADIEKLNQENARLREEIKEHDEENKMLSWQLDEALSAVRSFEKTHKDRDLFQAKIWFKSLDGDNNFSTFVNHAPLGGFKYDILDFEPKDKENYKPLFVHNFTIEDLDDLIAKSTILEDEITRLHKDNTILRDNNKLISDQRFDLMEEVARLRARARQALKGSEK